MIIGLQGKKRSGKDTVANFIGYNFIHQLGEGWERKSFAAPLKQLMTDSTGVDFFSDEDKETIQEFKIDSRLLVNYLGFTYYHHTFKAFRNEYPNCKTEDNVLYVESSKRKLLQFVGTDIARNLCGTNFWVDKLDSSGCSNIVVTDVRFPNEADKIRELGGFIITVERPGLESTDTHISEQLPCVGDYTIVNDGTLDDLATKVEELFNELRG